MLKKKQNIIKRKINILDKFSIFLIRYLYRKIIKPIRNNYNYNVRKRIILCSFYPDCSEYGILAIEKHGFLKGWFLTIKKILKCNKYKHEESSIDFP